MPRLRPCGCCHAVDYGPPRASNAGRTGGRYVYCDHGVSCHPGPSGHPPIPPPRPGWPRFGGGSPTLVPPSRGPGAEGDPSIEPYHVAQGRAAWHAKARRYYQDDLARQRPVSYESKGAILVGRAACDQYAEDMETKDAREEAQRRLARPLEPVEILQLE